MREKKRKRERENRWVSRRAIDVAASQEISVACWVKTGNSYMRKISQESLYDGQYKTDGYKNP